MSFPQKYFFYNQDSLASSITLQKEARIYLWQEVVPMTLWQDVNIIDPSAEY